MLIFKDGKYFLNVSQVAKLMPVSHFFLTMINQANFITTPQNIHANICNIGVLGAWGTIVLQLQAFQGGSGKKTWRGWGSLWLHGKKWRGKEEALPREALRDPVLLLNCRGGESLPVFQYTCIIFPQNASLDISECNNNGSNIITCTRLLKKSTKIMLLYMNEAKRARKRDAASRVWRTWELEEATARSSQPLCALCPKPWNKLQPNCTLPWKSRCLDINWLR